jgi:hypothetical protein
MASVERSAFPVSGVILVEYGRILGAIGVAVYNALACSTDP